MLEDGVLEGKKTFGNITKYIKMTASSNFGNMFSIMAASAFLPFLPMLPIHLLIQNLLYDISQTTIPFDRMKAFEQADLRHLTAQEYRHLASELEEGSREINALSGEILCLIDMVNDLCVILLAQGTAVSDLSCEQNTKEILKGIQTLFASKEWEDIPEEVTDRLPALEGKQEQYFEQWLRDDISLEELQEENGPEAEAAWKAGLLMSGSAFMSLEKPNADEAEVDEVFFREKLDALFKDMGERWKELPKAVVRAAMAKCLSSLPANFQSLDEAREYIQGSLNSCSDEIEREACADLIRSLMEE